jgi:hypothetical protein
MKYPGFVGGAYKLRSSNLDCQRCVNLYPVMDEMGTGKDADVAMLVSVPGKREFSDLDDGGPIRGLFTASNGMAFAVSFDNLYEINTDGTKTLIGNLGTQGGPVSFADNGVQLFVVDGVFGYIFTFSSNVFAQVTDPDMPRATHVRFLDGYFVLNQVDSGRFFITSLYDGYNIDALDFATAEGSPDNILAMEVLRKQLWLFGTESVQVYFNSGDLEFPLSPINGVFIETGIASPFSVVKVDQTLFWVGSNKDGDGVVYMATGYQPLRISTNAIEFAINSYGDISSCVGFGYQQEGATFYQINFEETSWVYDLNSRLWHERCAFLDGELLRDKANFHMFAGGKHLVGDYQMPIIYELDLDYHYDGDGLRKWLRAAPHLSKDLNYIYYSLFQVDLEFGVGTESGAGQYPIMIMRKSDDGGHSWTNERYASMGLIGEFKARAEFRREGRSRDRVYEISGTDPVRTVILAAYIDFKVGSR